MTREDEPKAGLEPETSGADEADDDAMRALLKRSLAGTGSAAEPKEMLRGVQKRLRTRSRGKFYGDGWSLSSSRTSYIAIAAGMLIVIAIAYFALGPMGVSAP